jgi:hypothetical protein
MCTQFVIRLARATMLDGFATEAGPYLPTLHKTTVCLKDADVAETPPFDSSPPQSRAPLDTLGDSC